MISHCQDKNHVTCLGDYTVKYSENWWYNVLKMLPKDFKTKQKKHSIISALEEGQYGNCGNDGTI
jgi:hypothetical protein